MEEEEEEEEKPYIYTIDYAKGNYLFPMNKTMTNCMDEVVQNLYNTKVHEAPNYLTVFGTNGRIDDLLPFTVMLNGLHSGYREITQVFGKMLKSQGVRAEIVVLVIHGNMPDLKLHPVSIVLGMTRGGDYKQVVIDYKAQRTIASVNISEEDQLICSSAFFGQTLIRPELSGAIWN